MNARAKRPLALALSLVFACSTPLAAFAEPSDQANPAPEAPHALATQADVAKIGSTNYTSVAAAIAAVPTTGIQTTISVLADSTETSPIVIDGGRSIVLDLGAGTRTIPRINLKSGSLTVQNGTLNCSDSQALNVYSSPTAKDPGEHAKLIVAASATVKTNAATDGFAVVLFPEVASTPAAGYGCQIDINGKLAGNLFVQGRLTGGNNVVNINGGAEITCPSTAEEPAGIALNGDATLNVFSGAKVSGETGIEVRAGTLNVYDGSQVIGNATALTSAANISGNATRGAGIAVVQHTTKLPATVNIYGGDISGYTALYENNVQSNSSTDLAKVNITVTGGSFTTTNTTSGASVNITDAASSIATITGGTYNKAFTETNLVPSSYERDTTSGKVSAKTANAVFEVGGSTYASLPDALAAVPTNGTKTTVKLLKDHTDDKTPRVVDNNMNAELNLNSHTLTDAAFQLKQGALAIKGGTLSYTTGTPITVSTSGDSTATAGSFASLAIESTATVTGLKSVQLVAPASTAAAGYGAKLDVSGKLNGPLTVSDDLTGGNSQIVLRGGSKVTTVAANTVGVALCGAADLTLESGSEVSGPTGVEARAGTVTVKDGAKVTGTGTSTTSAAAATGTSTSGAGIAVSQHSTQLPVQVSVQGGQIKGNTAFLEVNPQLNPSSVTSKIKVDITDGTFTSTATGSGAKAISVASLSAFLKAGNFSVTPETAYLASGYTAVKDAKVSGYYTVLAAGAMGISLNKTEASLLVDTSLDLVATVAGSPTATVTWSSSNEAVATVVNGRVTGVAEGEVTISALTYGSGGRSYVAKCKVTVETEPQRPEAPTPDSPVSPASPQVPVSPASPASPATPDSPQSPASPVTADTPASPQEPDHDGSSSSKPAPATAEEVASGVKLTAADGQPAQGWVTTGNGAVYYADAGMAKTGSQQIGGNTYLFDEAGKLRTFWWDDRTTGAHYYLYREDDPEPTGAMAKNRWLYVEEEPGWYVFDETGRVMSGWYRDPVTRDRYYLDSRHGEDGLFGKMQTGWLCDENANWYYLFNAEDNGTYGTLVEDGWLHKDGQWYYCSAGTGAIESGWKFWGGSWYFLSPRRDGSFGMLQRGWFTDLAGLWYLSDPTSGALRAGWQLWEGRWFHLSDRHDGSYGVMETGWYWSGSAWYYLQADGSMLVASWTPDGFYVDGTGRFVG